VPQPALLPRVGTNRRPASSFGIIKPGHPLNHLLRGAGPVLNEDNWPATWGAGTSRDLLRPDPQESPCLTDWEATKGFTKNGDVSRAVRAVEPPPL